jgi:cyclic pyranopterin phosphate synthase
MKKLSHTDEHGRVRMVDVSAKKVTGRVAEASAMVRLSPATIAILREHGGPKGDPIGAARIAGIMAAKKTADLIPLCHPLALTDVAVKADLMDDGVRLSATVRTNAQTGVEMEALTAVSVAALTIYDMCKAVQRDIEITDVRLDIKTGGKRPYKRK